MKRRIARVLTGGCSGAVLRVAWFLGAACIPVDAGAVDFGGGNRPSVLICSTRGAWQNHVDLDWLAELHQAGFECDYLDEYSEFTWERVRQHNVLVVYGAPAADASRAFVFPGQGPRLAEYVEIVERFLEQGGGVLAMIETDNADEHVKPMIEPWGVRLPFEKYVETDDARLVPMPRMPRMNLVLVDGIKPSPVTEGVHNLWFPYGVRYHTTWTAPISVSDDWQVVVTGSKTSRSEPFESEDLKYAKPEPPDALVRPDGVQSPPLAAIREYRNGRLFLMSQGPVFSIGQGTKWLYNRHCLSAGLKDTPSDFETLLHNVFRWLAEPSLAAATVGGYRSNPIRFTPPNYRPGVKEQFEKEFWSEAELDRHRPPRGGTVYRGLIGARSSLSGGGGTVAEYAAAARSAGLDFVAFMEPFNEITQAKFEQLEAECRLHSGDDLLLLPGYTIDSNIGNHMFFTGYGLPLPDDEVLVGSETRKLMVQRQEESGNFVHGPAAYLRWVLYGIDRYKGKMVGYYNFDDPRAMQVPDLKLSSAVAVKTYRDGQLIDERVDEYLLSAAGALTELPVSVNLVDSPQELIEEAASGNALTYAQGKSLSSLPETALRWNSQYDGMNVFASSGPIIQAWPQTFRAYTYGAEPFAVNFELMPSDLHVTSQVGLEEIRVMNGDRLFRRFLPGGAGEFREILQLPGNVQQNLIVVARDIDGGQAVSFTRRSWKPGSLNVVYCGDHVNDCGDQYLARGMGVFRTHRYPTIEGGYTWDGGPRGMLPVAHFGNNLPTLVSSAGREGPGFNNIPVMEFADHQAIVVRSVKQEVYDPAVPAVNAWHTSGPKQPSALLDSIRRYTEFNRPLVGPRPAGWAAQSVRSGAVLAHFANTLRFKQPQVVESLRLLNTNWERIEDAVYFVAGAPGSWRSHALGGESRTGFIEKIATGGCFGFYGHGAHNQVLFINGGEPVIVQARVTPATGSFMITVSADIEGEAVDIDDTHVFELFSVNEPLDLDLRGVPRFERVLDYLASPTGLQLLGGRRRPTPGFFDVEMADIARVVDIRVPRPEPATGLTLPVRISGLNPRWSAGLFQVQGHTTGFYTDGRNVYTALGFDFDGRVYAALYPDQVDETHVRIGHPVVCDREELFLDAIPRTSANDTYQWHVAVNNPTDAPVTAVFRQGMELPGLDWPEQTHTVPAGGYLVLSER